MTTIDAPDSGTSAGFVRRLREEFGTGRTREPAWRVAQLRALELMLLEREAEFAAALAADLGRTAFDAVLLDLASTRAEVRHALRHVRSWARPRRVRAPLGVRPGRAWYRYEPLGVVLVIGPWNYPVHLVLAPLVAAIAAGNCAVLKPSEITPACSAVLARLVPEYLDPAAFAVVQGGADTTLDLIDQAPDHCFFTGSPGVGAAVLAAAARHLVPVTLELGGKCPVIVAGSARPDVAARRVAFGKLLNSGQTCVAPDHVLVAAGLREAFVEHLVAAIGEFSGGGDLPVVNARHAARLADLLAGAGGGTRLGGRIDVAAARANRRSSSTPTRTPRSAGRRSSAPSCPSSRWSRWTRRSRRCAACRRPWRPTSSPRTAGTRPASSTRSPQAPRSSTT